MQPAKDGFLLSLGIELFIVYCRQLLPSYVLTAPVVRTAGQPPELQAYTLRIGSGIEPMDHQIDQ
jgi:hypothetical protein